MARLPVPGSDDNQWGTLLNEFLRVAHNEDGTLRAPVGPTAIDTIAQLKNVDPAAVADNHFVFVKGFDAPGDGGGGLFYWEAGTLSNTLDGVAMNSNVAGAWRRHYHGPIHTRWAGIKRTATPNSFDQEGIAAANRARWNNLNDYCRQTLWQLIGDGKAHVVVDTIFLDAGIHDFDGNTIFIGQGVGLDGNGPGRSVLRFNNSSGTCIQVGDPGDRIATKSLESAFDVVKNVSIVHFTQASTGTEIGIAFDNTLRRCELFNVHVQGFNVNADINAFGMDIRHCFFADGFRTNLKIGPQGNSMMIVGCRIDDQRNASTGESILVDHSGGARSILFLRCDIQRAERVALRSIGVASLAIRDCFFEGNNQDDGFHPDIWIEGNEVRNVVIDGCYFTGTGRFNGDTSRAINIRGDVTAAARIQITNNQQADSAQGTFAQFIDIDANVAMEVVAFNNINSAGNSIPGNVVVKSVS